MSSKPARRRKRRMVDASIRSGLGVHSAGVLTRGTMPRSIARTHTVPPWAAPTSSSPRRRRTRRRAGISPGSAIACGQTESPGTTRPSWKRPRQAPPRSSTWARAAASSCPARRRFRGERSRPRLWQPNVRVAAARLSNQAIPVVHDEGAIDNVDQIERSPRGRLTFRGGASISCSTDTRRTPRRRYAACSDPVVAS